MAKNKPTQEKQTSSQKSITPINEEVKKDPIINTNKIEIVENNEELLNAVKLLLNDLDGIFIGGHAQSSKQALEQLINRK